MTVGTADDNLRVQLGAPCIDAGHNDLLPTAITQDLDGAPRFVDDPSSADTGSGTPPIVDMGAYEYSPANAGASVLEAVLSRKSHAEAGELDLILFTAPATFAVESRAGGIETLVLRLSGPVRPRDGALDSTEIAVTHASLVSAALHEQQILVQLAGVQNGSCIKLTLQGLEDLAATELPALQLSLGSLLGDTNSDGIVNHLDALQIKSLTAANHSAASHPECDLNRMGSINLLDVMFDQSLIQPAPRLLCAE
jgi:hypothetical protein